MTAGSGVVRGVHVVDLGGVGDAATAVEALTGAIDPELGLDVLELGLVYELHLAGRAATVIMTLTTPGCPLHGAISRDVEACLLALEGVDAVDVQLVWDPPWTPARISAAGRALLGWPETPA